MATKKGMATGVEVARISVKVSPDSKQFRRDLQSDLDKIEQSVTAKINVEPNMGNFRSEVNAKTKGMSTKVKVDADTGGFMSRMKDIFKPPNFGSGINPSGYAAILAGIAVVAGPLVGLLTTALLAVPGLIAGIAAPMAAIMLGLDGIKKAAEVLKAPFDHLKATMSSVNQAAFTPVFEKLGKIFPTIEKSLPSVSKGLASVAQSIADAFTSPENMNKFEGSITNIGEMFRRAAPGIGDFTTGINTLINEFSKKMPAIGDWLSGAGTDFMNWIDKMSKDGTLSTAFDSLGGTIKQILDGLGGLAKKGMEFMSDPEKMKNFQDGLQTVINLLNTIMDVSSKINGWKAPDWLKKMADMGKTDTKPSKQPQQQWGALDKAEQWINDAFTTKSGKIGTDVDFSAIGQKLKDAVNPDNLFGAGTTAGLGEKLKEAFNPANILPELTTLKTQITAAINPDNLFGAGTTAGLGEKLKQAFNVQNLVGELQGVFSTISSMASGAWNGIASAASSAWNGVVSAVSTAWSTITSAVSTGVATAVQFVSELPGKIQAFFADAGTWLLDAGKNVVQGLIDGIGSMIDTAVGKAQELAGSVKNAVTNFLGIHSPSKVFEQLGIFTGQGYAQGLDQGFQPVLDQAKDLAGKISATFANGGDPTSLIDGYSKSDIKRIEKVLALETKKLESQAKALDYQAKVTGDESLKNRAKDIRLQKDQLSLQKDMLDLTQEYSDTMGGTEDPLVKAAANLMNSPVDFAKATGKQFFSDLGINGDGFISKALTEGTKYIFQIGSVDEALSIKDREESKNILPLIGRG